MASQLQNELVLTHEPQYSTLSPLELYVGCSGWSHHSWKDRFYPSSLDHSNWLKYYSKIFDYVEIDSSFYTIPNRLVVRNWYGRTPAHFKFTAKFPKIITHDKKLIRVEGELDSMLSSISELKDKLFCLLIQLPRSIKMVEGKDLLNGILSTLNPAFRYAVEVRDRSWFHDVAYDFFADNNICMVWSQLLDIQTPPVVTTDFVYLRLIGDITTDNPGKMRMDRIGEMQYWANKVEQISTDELAANKVRHVIVTANDSYTGFGPDTANLFRRVIGLKEVRWNDKTSVQRKISDFGNLSKQSTIYDFSTK